MITEKKRLWLKAYRQRNKEHIKKVSHARYIKMRTQRLAHWKEKYYENPQHFIEMGRKSAKKHIDRIRIRSRIKYQKNRDKELIRQKTVYYFGHLIKTGSCQTCGSKEKLTFHHPTKPYKYDIFQILCFKCHGKIHGKNHFVFDGNPEQEKKI